MASKQTSPMGYGLDLDDLKVPKDLIVGFDFNDISRESIWLYHLRRDDQRKRDY